MFFWKKERQIEQAFEEYLQETERCIAAFSEAFDVYFREGLRGQFEALVDKTHLSEHAADEKRRQIEAMMYQKALIPESRGDILGLLEALDLVPNQCESVLYQIWTQGMGIPQAFVADTRSLVSVNAECHALLCQAARNLFDRTKRVTIDAELISRKEHESDQIERRMVKSIFDSQIDKADKILLKELVINIGGVSDCAEDAADRLRIIAVKRQN